MTGSRMPRRAWGVLSTFFSSHKPESGSAVGQHSVVSAAGAVRSLVPTRWMAPVFFSGTTSNASTFLLYRDLWSAFIKLREITEKHYRMKEWWQGPKPLSPNQLCPKDAPATANMISNIDRQYFVELPRSGLFWLQALGNDTSTGMMSQSEPVLQSELGISTDITSPTLHD
ncbi:hypothetical protein BJ170DRAFT_725807 [Xylariales sp. AK1849]|nr:hypothetical protein BJ170DRAFT_725807 [Xylariales sp. AK1849]